MSKIKALIAGLDNGLKFQVEGDPVDDIQGVSIDVGECYGNDGFGYVIEICKPHLFPLPSLTKEIRVEGYNDDKAFVPMEELSEMSFDYDDPDAATDLYYDYGKQDWYLPDPQEIKNLPSWVVDFMNDWHFNTLDLLPSDYIDASESKVYEPKKHESC